MGAGGLRPIPHFSLDTMSPDKDVLFFAHLLTFLIMCFCHTYAPAKYSRAAHSQNGTDRAERQPASAVRILHPHSPHMSCSVRPYGMYALARRCSQLSLEAAKVNAAAAH